VDVTGQTAEPGFDGVYSLHPTGKALPADLAGEASRIRGKHAAILSPQHQHGGVMAEGDQRAIGVGHGAFGLTFHQRCIFVDIAAGSAEHLAPEAALELSPATALPAQLTGRYMAVERNEAAGEAVRHGHSVMHIGHERPAG
jgi:hypothetical protein